MDRKQKLLVRISPSDQKGLEIGPLINPIVNRNEGAIWYMDHTSTEELRLKYKDNKDIDIKRIVDVDYVWGEKSIREMVGAVHKFDYVIASHVIEHIPDPIGWFKEIADVLPLGGILSLAVPDKRYTFDYNREVSAPCDMIEAYIFKMKKPSIRNIFDSHGNHVTLNAHQAWSDQFDRQNLNKSNTYPDIALKYCQEYFETGKYIDSHCYVFTPYSFFDILKILISLDLFDFKVATFFPTEHSTDEFFLTLEKIEHFNDNDSDAKHSIQLNSLPKIAKPQGNKQLANQIAAMQNSSSWRLTAPLRYIKLKMTNLLANK